MGPDRRGGVFIFSAISAGDGHTCALTSAGIAYCWGLDFYGELGDSSPRYDASIPMPVSGNLRFASISTGTVHTCGVTTTGTAYCWGNNEFGRLGNNSTQDNDFPVPVAGGLTFLTIAAGNEFTCGNRTDGTLYCWGRKLGGSAAFDSTPVLLPSVAKFAYVSAGNVHACGLTISQMAFCWGMDTNGQLGDGRVVDESLAVSVSGNRLFTVLSSGITHTCGIGAGDTTFCWGALADFVYSSPLPIAGPP